jgi:predicted nucleic acid-binding protein
VTGWLLDSNVLSELRRLKPDRKVVAAQPLDLLNVSTVTLAEIRFGIELLTDANRRAGLNLRTRCVPCSSIACSMSPRT